MGKKIEKTHGKPHGKWKVSEKFHFRAAPGDTRRRDPVARASARSGRCRSLRVWGQRSPEFSTGGNGGKAMKQMVKKYGMKGDMNGIFVGCE